MIKVSNLKKVYGKQILFKDLNFNINRSGKIGQWEEMGLGKPPCFKLILGGAGCFLNSKFRISFAGQTRVS